MAVRRRQVDGSAARAVTRLGNLHLQFRTGGEPLSKARNELVADVLDNENRRRKGGGELRQQLAERLRPAGRSEEHTSELQSLMRISYAVFCLKKKNTKNPKIK